MTSFLVKKKNSQLKPGYKTKDNKHSFLPNKKLVILKFLTFIGLTKLLFR